MRRLFAIGAVALSAACGDSTSPPPFPAVNGTYNITIEFDAFTASEARGTGQITFQQASRNEGTLTGSGNITLIVGTESGTVSTVTNAAVDEDGSITFRIGNSSGTTFWGFDGQVTNGGAKMSGTHILTDGTDSFTGTWSATRQ